MTTDPNSRPIQFTLHGIDHGISSIHALSANHYATRTGYAFFCPACATVWATGRIPGESTFPLSIPCGCHPSPEALAAPGSLWLSWDRAWNAALPFSILESEFLSEIKNV